MSTLAFASEDADLADAALATWLMFKDNLQAGRRGPRASLAEALDFSRTPEFADRRAGIADAVYVGPPAEVADRLRGLVADCQADELVIVSPLGEPEPRTRSYELIAGELGLTAG